MAKPTDEGRREGATETGDMVGRTSEASRASISYRAPRLDPIGEGSLQAPRRHALDWRNPEFYDEEALAKELERVFDICHGCRRCVSLCQSFPTLFDLVDESPTMEVDGVKRKTTGRSSTTAISAIFAS